jgi:hypothetical protein
MFDISWISLLESDEDDSELDSEPSPVKLPSSASEASSTERIEKKLLFVLMALFLGK